MNSEKYRTTFCADAQKVILCMFSFYFLFLRVTKGMVCRRLCGEYKSRDRKLHFTEAFVPFETMMTRKFGLAQFALDPLYFYDSVLP